MLQELLPYWNNSETFTRLVKNIESSKAGPFAVSGMEGSALVYFFAALAVSCRRPALIICRDDARAEKIYTDLLSFSPPEKLGVLPARDPYFAGDILAHSGETRQQRVDFMARMQRQPELIFVATGSALATRTLLPGQWNKLINRFQPGAVLDREDLIVRLSDGGYERVSLTEQKGQFSVRGDIVDIFPADNGGPVRIELFDDTIHSLRRFDPETQRSKDALCEAIVPPAYELPLTSAVSGKGNKEIFACLNAALASLKRRGELKTAERLEQHVKAQIDSLSQPDGLEKLYSYFPFFYGEGASLLQYLPSDALILIEEPAAVSEKSEALQRELDDYNSARIIEGDLLPSSVGPLWTEEELFKRSRLTLLLCSLFPGKYERIKAQSSYSIEAKSVPHYHGQWELAEADFKQWFEEGFLTYLAAASEKRAIELLKLTSASGSEPASWSTLNTEPEKFIAKPAAGSLEEGFIVPSARLVVVAESNILPRAHKKKRISKLKGARLQNYRELSVGDYIVHEAHGIGKYQGLVTLEISNTQRDYMLLRYRGTDKLYIPVDQIALIQKYSGSEAKEPRLNSLGGGDWQRLKQRIKASVEELAGELLSLYAARKSIEGFCYGPDHPWQQEFEAHFPFEETPDQLKAIDDVKSDMEKAYPMDRLICGDVGYGKTEVALRAAFKAALEGKQTAILVPTTILAQQHYRTFQERFADFPFKVAQLSRFVPAAEQKKIIKNAAHGSVDILIGTHRLLSNDLHFKDLGLLIIDEEHRFGVRHKEKMKQLRLEVDTLAMTATPIPRTLHLSLAGARDMSVIDTPPENRYPVQTYVLEYSENQIRDAIRRELERQGQIFYVHNRVGSIGRITKRLQDYFPDAAIAVAHGRLAESSLERIMADFQANRYNILVSTTIIEAGLDIPNVNTLVIDDADKFGLAQLYQLRGRVGRSERLAYAYLTYRKNKILSEVAQKRLRAIKEFTELGSGFKIALRDLQIRGAGNILGAEQHGFITAIGFDLYCTLLNRAIAELKNEKPVNIVNPKIELPVDAFLPAAYIQEQEQKVDFYQRIYSAGTEDELLDVRAELLDRFGLLPAEAEKLLEVAGLRLMAKKLNIEQIQQQKNRILLTFSTGHYPGQAALGKLAAAAPGSLKPDRSDPPVLKIILPEADVNTPELLKRLLIALAAPHNGAHHQQAGAFKSAESLL